MPSLAPIIYGVIGFLAIVGALIGLSRGLAKQTVRSITIVLSVIISFVAVSMLYGTLSDYLDGMTMTDVVNKLIELGVIPSNTDTALIEKLDVKTVELALALPLTLVILPLLFVICFMVVSLLMLIIHAIICAICGFKSYKNNAITRLLGMVLGCVQGAVVAGILMLPIIGLSNVVADSRTVLMDKAPNEEFTASFNEVYDDYAKELVENPAVEIYSSLGFNALYKGIATVEIDGQNEDLTEILNDVLIIATDVYELRDANFERISAEDEATIRAIINKIDRSPYFSTMIAGIIKSASYAYTDGDLGITVDEPFDELIDSAVSIFHTSSPTNIGRDLTTLADVYFILSNDGIISALTGSDGDDILDALVKKDASGKTTINKVVDTIRANERTRSLVTLMTKLSVSVMSDSVGLGEEVLETYENIKDSINNDILSLDTEAEDYVENVSAALDNVLKDNNIELEPEIVETMAEEVANYIKENNITEISDEAATDMLLTYYDAYVDYLENGTIPDELPDGLPDNIPDGILP